jgi:hypothetical protein
MACSLSFGAPDQLQSLEGQEHGRTIPLYDISQIEMPQCSSLTPPKGAQLSTVTRPTSGFFQKAELHKLGQAMFGGSDDLPNYPQSSRL